MTEVPTTVFFQSYYGIETGDKVNYPDEKYIGTKDQHLKNLEEINNVIKKFGFDENSKATRAKTVRHRLNEYKKQFDELYGNNLSLDGNLSENKIVLTDKVSISDNTEQKQSESNPNTISNNNVNPLILIGGVLLFLT